MMAGPEFLTADGVQFRDLNHNGRLDRYEDPRLPVSERVADLVAQLDDAELAGLMFHTVIEAGPGGELLDGPGRIAKSGSRQVVVDKRMNHFNVHALTSARQAACWANRLQELACQTPHSIPVTISTDPRHATAENVGTSWSATFFSQWPDPLGLAALGDPELVRTFFDVVRREYLAVGIRAALHPTADLATEPRWGRQRETFGENHELAARLVRAAVLGLQGDRLGPHSVSATTKHFPGAGPQAGGEDAHFPYGRDQVYPGGRFAEHLAPFEAAIEAGTAAIMPYYARPVGLVLDGQPIEEVGFGYNHQMLTGLLRQRLGFDGVILSDWELVSDNVVADKVLPARAWGVEHLGAAERMLKLLAAGIDQFGGEERVEMLLELVSAGRVRRERLVQSASRLLRVKFALGLFDNPFVSPDAAEQLVGTPDAMALGLRTQARSVVLCADRGVLPVRRGTRVWLEGVSPDAVGDGLRVVPDPSQADIALVRLPAPFEPRDDLFLEAMFHQGSLDFPPGLPYRLARLPCPVVIDVMADRPAICTPLLEVAAALTVSFGVSDAAWVMALTGEVPPEGQLPVSLPRSMAAVRASLEDVPGDADPLFPAGYFLDRTL